VPLNDGRRVRTADPASKPTLTDTVHQSIRDRIILGEIQGGEMLIESQLAQEFGVSKTPIREALSLLSQAGFVEVIPRQGYRVTTISVKDVHEIYELRVLLEGEAAALAAQRAAPQDYAEFRKTMDRLSAEVEAKEGSLTALDVMRIDDAFHMGVAGLTKNSRLQTTIQRLLQQATRVRWTDPHLSPEGILAEGEGSERIYVALEQRDPNAARALMVDHVLHSKERVLEGILDPTPNQSIELRAHQARRR